MRLGGWRVYDFVCSFSGAPLATGDAQFASAGGSYWVMHVSFERGCSMRLGGWRIYDFVCSFSEAPPVAGAAQCASAAGSHWADVRKFRQGLLNAPSWLAHLGFC